MKWDVNNTNEEKTSQFVVLYYWQIGGLVIAGVGVLSGFIMAALKSYSVFPESEMIVT